MKHADMARQQADMLIAEMAKGHSFLPFLKPGDPSLVGGLPYNPTTGKAYRGGNMVMLWIAAMESGFADSRWMTYRQAQALGAQVRKGAKSVPLRYVRFPGRDEEADESVASSTQPRAFHFHVFNAEQIDGLRAPAVKAPLAPASRNAKCEALLRNSGAVIVHGSASPHYSPGSDRIGLPQVERFVSYEAYLATALHELAHWTGHASRLNRDLSGKYGSLSYAREELVAETASHIMGVELGIGHDPSQHAAYLAHWIAIAKEEPGYIYKAAAMAEKVCDFLNIERYQHEPLVVEQENEEEVVPAVAARALPALEMTL